MAYLVINAQFLQQLQKPVHRSGGFDPHQNLAGSAEQNFRTSSPSCWRVFSINSPVSLSNIATLCCRVCTSTPIIRISASFGPSAVTVNTETVYSGRCEAGVVMTSV
jgi:hypothetical protein